MLTDPEEIAIIAKARQKNVRDPHRSRVHFDNIFEDFFHDVPFDGAVLMDLGPGQFDFGVLARARGATDVFGIDNDPAVVELGRHKGFSVEQGQLRSLTAETWPDGFDGVFCKFSLNAFWFGEEITRLEAHVSQVASLIRPDGWGWIAPWNGIPKNDPPGDKEVERILQTQEDAFSSRGFDVFLLNDSLAKRYGISGAVVNHALFVRNLSVPDEVAACRKI